MQVRRSTEWGDGCREVDSDEGCAKATPRLIRLLCGMIFTDVCRTGVASPSCFGHEQVVLDARRKDNGKEVCDNDEWTPSTAVPNCDALSVWRQDRTGDPCGDG